MATTYSPPFAPPLQESLWKFFTYHPPREVSQRLRTLLLDYLAHELKTGIPVYLPELLIDLNALFDVLDTAAQGIETANQA